MNRDLENVSEQLLPSFEIFLIAGDIFTAPLFSTYFLKSELATYLPGLLRKILYNPIGLQMCLWKNERSRWLIVTGFIRRLSSFTVNTIALGKKFRRRQAFVCIRESLKLIQLTKDTLLGLLSHVILKSLMFLQILNQQFSAFLNWFCTFCYGYLHTTLIKVK